MGDTAEALDETTVGAVDIAEWTVRRLGFGAMRIVVALRGDTTL